MKTIKFLISGLFFFVLLTNLAAYENSIITKVDNEIITYLDIKKETVYLKLLNKNLNDMESEMINKIAKNSLIREKIKIIELKKNYDELKIDDEYLNQLISLTFKKVGFTSEENFKNVIFQNNLDYNEIKKKIVIEALWNELIIYKFFSKLNINEKTIKENFINKKNDYKFTYFLSEILFEVDNTEKLKEKKDLIKTTIINQGFENAALIHSISNTANMGGKIGPIEFEALNNSIKNSIKNLKIGEYSEPILMPNGFLILKIDDIEKTKIETDIDFEVKKIINIKKNQQLNQYSNSYYNKIKKDINVEDL